MKMNINTLIVAAIITLFGIAAQAQTLIIGEPNNQLPSQAIRVNSFEGVISAPLMNFTLSASGGDALVKTIQAEIHQSSTASTMYLFSGSTLIDATSVQNGRSGTFNVFTTIPQGTTKEYTIQADFGTDTPSVSPEARVSVNTVTFETPAGNQGFATGEVTGNTMHFFTEVAKYQLAGTPSIKTEKSGVGNEFVIATFPLFASAFGGNIALPQSSDFTVEFKDIVSNQSFGATSISVVALPNTPIADGSTAQVLVTASLAGPNVNIKGLYVAKMNSIHWSIGSTNALQSWGIDDMVTPMTNVSGVDMNKLTIINSSFRNGESIEQDNTFVMTYILPKNTAVMLQHSSDLETWTPAQLAGSRIATLHNGNHVLRAPIPASQGATRGFYRIVETQ
jgi:hypothetical protein